MDYIPNDESNPFQSLADLILKNESIAILAEAIDSGGIYCWDRFGRFKKDDKSYKETALDLLAKHRDWERESAFSREEEQNPLEDYMHPLYGFGWAKKVLPKFDEIRKNIDLVEPPKSKSAVTKINNSYLLVIAAFGNKLNLDISKEGKVGGAVAPRIKEIIDDFGSSLNVETIQKMLEKLPNAVDLKSGIK